MLNLLKYFFILSLFIGGHAYALRCGNHLISPGDSQATVIARCGQPVTKTKSYVERGVVHNMPHGKRSLYDTVVIEHWTYNFGPQALMQTLVFENGILKHIQRESNYGFIE